MSDVLVHTITAMGTVVTIQVVGDGTTSQDRRRRHASVERAAGWFHEITRTCSRFDPNSELRQITADTNVPKPVSALLFEAIRFALAVAEESDGAFDPTVGHELERRGFNKEFRTGAVMDSGIADEGRVTFRDIELDPVERTVTIRHPLVLDLGGLVKGLAIDLAARELQPHANFGIDAGGDLYLRGHNTEDEPWSVGIKHPRDPTQILRTLSISEAAVCTSGDYERMGAQNPAEHHLIDPRTNGTAAMLASATVIAPSAMVADALATAAFVLGPDDGLAFLERQGVEGLLVTPTLDCFATKGMPGE